MKAGVLSPCIDPGPTGPPALMDVISCRCRAAGKACAAICSCKKEGLSCTIYCLCQSRDEWCNHHNRSQHVDDEDEKNGGPQEYEALDADSSSLWMLTVHRIVTFIAIIIVI